MAKHQIGTKHYARVPLQTTGRDAWEQQDITGVWSDNGEVRTSVVRHMDQLIVELESVVARNAMIGASDYLAEGEASLALSPDNDILLGIRIYNDGASMIAHVSMRQILFSALQELRPRLGVDPQAQAVLSQIVALGQQLARLGAPAKPKEDTAA